MLYNGSDGPIVCADSDGEEGDFSGNHLDFLSNGFKVRNDGNHQGQNETHIYAAFAETPFKYATAR